MMIKASFAYTCKYCDESVILYLYEGLDDDSRMGFHFCAGTREASLDPNWEPMDGLIEVK